MGKRIGGLVISRKAGECIQLDYPDGQVEMVEVKNLIDGGAVIRVGNHHFDLLVGDSVGIRGLDSSSTGIYLESIEGGRVAIRIIADDRIRILRTELLRRSR